MSTVNAIFENGVFRPTEHVDLPESCSVELQVRLRDAGADNREPDVGDDAAVPRREKKSIEQKIAEIVADVPAEAWDGMPEDLSEQLDHYLYGLPKR